MTARGLAVQGYPAGWPDVAWCGRWSARPRPPLSSGRTRSYPRTTRGGSILN